ncbi:unnamed protein product, partial [Symbiodinium microadriaticum]
DLLILSEFSIDENLSSREDCLCVSEAHGMIVVVSASSTVLVPYGGSKSPAALRCTLVSISSGQIVTEYDIPFVRVAYFSSTLRTYTHESLLMVSCWDDMQLKVLDLLSGEELFVLEKNEESESLGSMGGLQASVKCVAASAEHIAVGYEWQRFIKACPLRVYSTRTGERLHCLAANGASPKCLAIHAGHQLLFSSAEHQKEVRVWSLEHGTRLYSLPTTTPDLKVVNFVFRPADSMAGDGSGLDGSVLLIRSNAMGYTPHSMRLDDELPARDPPSTEESQGDELISLWRFDKTKTMLHDALSTDNGTLAGVQVVAGKVLKSVVKKRRRI